MIIRKKQLSKNIYNNTEVYYGLGACSCLKAIEEKDILLLVSKSVQALEDFQKFKSYFVDKNLHEEIVNVSTEENIFKLKRQYMDKNIQLIVAVGGGKVLDSAKVLKAMLDNPNLSFESLAKTQNEEKSVIKLIAIPTTPGTGSEANSIAVIRNSHGKKIPYINQMFVPNLAILDHKFMISLKEKELYEFSADIFSHCFEGSFSRLSSPLLQAIAKSSLNLLVEAFTTIHEKPDDKNALANILYSGHLAGLVQGNAYVGACHALAHSLEERVEISHGGSILSLLKPYMQWLQKIDTKNDYSPYLTAYEKIGFDKFRTKDAILKPNPDEWAEASLQDPTIKTNHIKMAKENMLELISWIQKHE